MALGAERLQVRHLVGLRPVIELGGDPADEPSVEVVIVDDDSGVLSEDTVSVVDTAEHAGPTDVDYGWNSWGEAILWIGGISAGLFVLLFLVMMIFG